MSNASFLGTGWSFPPTFEVSNYQLNMTHEQHNINQSIDLILQTNQGERSLMPLFGSPLRHFLFKSLNAPLQNEIINAVKIALLEHEPRISVNNVRLEPLTEQSGVSIYIDYTIRLTNSRFNHVYPFVLNDATNLVTNTGGL